MSDAQRILRAELRLTGGIYNHCQPLTQAAWFPHLQKELLRLHVQVDARFLLTLLAIRDDTRLVP
jgi:hypothetical protein